MTRVVPAPSPTAATPEPAVGGAPACRFCAAPLRHTFVDLGMSPLCESFVAAERPEPDGAVLPAARAGCASAASWCSSRSTSRPRTSSPSTRTSPSYSDSWVAHARALRRGDDRPPRTSAPRASWSSWPATTATCCSTSWPGASRCSASSRPRNVAEAAVERGRADAGRRSSARETARRAGRRARFRRPDRRQQRARPGARPERLRGRDRRSCSRPTAWRPWSSRTCCG